MRKVFGRFCVVVVALAIPVLAQEKRLWILRSPGEMVEYDPATFAMKQTVKVPAEAVQSPQNLTVNHEGQMLFAAPVSLPLSDSDSASPHKAWFWNGRSATNIDVGVKHEVSTAGSNRAVTESAPAVYLAADGSHLFWFANRQRRLQREDVDLSVTTTWQAWQTDLTGAAREDLASMKLPECRCTTGACEESCPYGVIWAPDGGVGEFFLVTQLVAGQTGLSYRATTLYRKENGKWTATPSPDPLQRVLDTTPTGDVIVEAIPDTGCCGWSNQSNDQTLVIATGKTQVVFDEQATYKNPDYDVSFYTSNARISPDHDSVAMTIVATAQANQPIQLAEQGQANPEESQQIRKALTQLPAVEIKSLGDAPRRIAFLPHSTAIGWLSDKELLIIENQLLVAYNVSAGTRRKSTIHVDDAARVFLR